jgi:hypothetical protein
MAQAIDSKRDGSRIRADFEGLFDIILGMKDFLEFTKQELYEIRRRLESEGTMTPEDLCASLGLNPMVHYVRYTSDTQNLVHVLNKPTECSVWGRFCSLAAANELGQAVLFFTLKGGINLVITNVPLIIPPGIVHHCIKSADEAINDVVIFRADYADKFFYPHFLKG